MNEGKIEVTSPTPYLSKSEIKQLIVGGLYALDGRATSADLKRVVEWAEGIRFNMSLLESALAGEIGIFVDVDGKEFAKRIVDESVKKKIVAAGETD